LNGRVNITDELEWTWKLHLLHKIFYSPSILLGVTEENSEKYVEIFGIILEVTTLRMKQDQLSTTLLYWYKVELLFVRRYD
jgi:hypothetical protein